jgi:hypothetical protein
MPPENQKDIQKRERTTIDDAREQGIGEAEEGIDLAVPSFADDGGTSDLGVDEPVVPKPLRGAPSPEPERGEER